MFARFTDIVNNLKALGSDMPNTELINKILRSLPMSLEPKVTVILEAKDHTMLKPEQLIGPTTKDEAINFKNEKKRTKISALRFLPM